jgi:hypothetical protein
MKDLALIFFLVVISSSSGIAKESGKSLASTLEIYVFPGDGQEEGQQSQDEAVCYEWAVGNTGVDPFDLQKKSQEAEQQTEQQIQQAQSATQGAGVKGAVGGAAAGAVIGEIVDDDASQGAAYGAAAGAVSSRRRSRRASAEAQHQAEEQGAVQQQEIQEQSENFKNAFGVCLEAKDYLVKF